MNEEYVPIASEMDEEVDNETNMPAPALMTKYSSTKYTQN